MLVYAQYYMDGEMEEVTRSGERSGLGDGRHR